MWNQRLEKAGCCLANELTCKHNFGRYQKIIRALIRNYRNKIKLNSNEVTSLCIKDCAVCVAAGIGLTGTAAHSGHVKPNLCLERDQLVSSWPPKAIRVPSLA